VLISAICGATTLNKVLVWNLAQCDRRSRAVVGRLRKGEDVRIAKEIEDAIGDKAGENGPLDAIAGRVGVSVDDQL